MFDLFVRDMKMSVDPRWAAVLVSIVALVISVVALYRTRNSLVIYIGQGSDGETLEVTNGSPHAVTLVEVGVVMADGRLSPHTNDETLNPFLPLRLDARDFKVVMMDEGMSIFKENQRHKYGRAGVYCKVATGEVYCSVVYRQRLCWWLRSLGGARSKGVR